MYSFFFRSRKKPKGEQKNGNGGNQNVETKRLKWSQEKPKRGQGYQRPYPPSRTKRKIFIWSQSFPNDLSKSQPSEHLSKEDEGQYTGYEPPVIQQNREAIRQNIH